MNNNTTIFLQNNNNIFHQRINNECCIVLKDSNYAATLNSTATCIFMLFLSKLNNNYTTITIEEIVNEIKTNFVIPDNYQDNLKKDIEDILSHFKKIGLLVK